MARIYRAEHEGLRRHVALKVLNEGFARDREAHERFLREARIAAAIKHPNVVNIFDVGVQNSVPYLVMEFLEGENLETMVRAERSLSEATLVDIAVPIVAGLSAVHDAGFVHRDLKPGNIFLARGRNDETEPKLLDFGISRAAETKPLRVTASRGLIMGTPRYMSPEAIRGEEITALSDQYSLGVVLYECSTGINPFETGTLAETARRVMAGDFAPPSQYNPALSRRLVKIIERSMTLDPNARFKDLKEMGRELLSMAGQRTRITWSLSFGEVPAERGTGNATGAVEAVTERNHAPRAPRSVAPRSQSRFWDRRTSSIAALLGLVALIAGVAVLLWSPATEEQQTHSLQPSSAAPAASPPAKPAPPPEKAPAPEKAPPPERAAAPVPDDRSRNLQAEEADDEPPPERTDRKASRNQTDRNTARAVLPQRRPPPPPVEPVDEPEEPDWAMPINSSKKARKPRPLPPQGTNSALIFE
jgi:serine/threonine-protein kinase